MWMTLKLSGFTGGGNMKPFKLFVASWCRPCKKLQSHIDEMEQAAELDTTRIEVIDIDTSDGNAEARNYNVQGVPTLIKLDDEGEVSDIIVGYRTTDQLKEIFS